MADPFTFTPPDYTNFAGQTGFGYNSLFDQMKDAFSIPGRGGGVFMGNQAPRYGKPAPNLTFPTQFQDLLAQFIHPQQQGGGPQMQGRSQMGLLQPFNAPAGMARGR